MVVLDPRQQVVQRRDDHRLRRLVGLRDGAAVDLGGDVDAVIVEAQDDLTGLVGDGADRRQQARHSGIGHGVISL